MEGAGGRSAHALMQWEYKIEYAPDDTAREVLDRFGKQGWEAWAISANKFGATIYFKRPYGRLGSS